MAGARHTKCYEILLGELVSIRQNAGLSQAQLAKRLNKPPSFVGKYELGERRLDVVELLVILRRLGAAPEPLIAKLTSDLPDTLKG